MVTGVDLVRQQLLIAAGDGLEVSSNELRWHGHAIECRINAEDPLRNFLPSPGRIVDVREPKGLGLRVDGGVAAGSVVPPFYDPLLAKLIGHGATRGQAIRRVRRGVEAFVVRGCHTTLPFHRALLGEPHFLRGDLWTTMVADLRIAERLRGRGPWEERVAAIAAAIEAGGRLAAGPMYALEATKSSRWSRSVRTDRPGGGGALPRRHRW
jgi:acetyl/propionyl-CoA carboxylase alpha subunit